MRMTEGKDVNFSFPSVPNLYIIFVPESIAAFTPDTESSNITVSSDLSPIEAAARRNIVPSGFDGISSRPAMIF